MEAEAEAEAEAAKIELMEAEAEAEAVKQILEAEAEAMKIYRFHHFHYSSFLVQVRNRYLGFLLLPCGFHWPTVVIYRQSIDPQCPLY